MIYTNTVTGGRGISVQNGFGQLIVGNIVKNVVALASNWSTAINLQNVNNSLIQQNNVKNSYQGINVQYITNTGILYNTMVSNSQGMQASGYGINMNIKYNTIAYNTNGLSLQRNNGNGPLPQAYIKINNFYSNKENLSEATNYDLSTNWWGTSIAGTITSKLSQNGSGSWSYTYTPYRLWHQFNLTPGADDYCLPSVTGFTSKYTNNNVNLNWNSTAGSKNYYVYRAAAGNYGVLNHAIPFLRTTTTNTFYTDISPSKGIYYYWVNNGDNPGAGNSLTNESWYVTMQAATVGVGTNVWNQQKNKWYYSIQAAVLDASNNNKLIVMPYGYPVSGSQTYNEQVQISSPSLATNLKIVARDWTNSHIIDTTIDGTGNANGLAIIVYSNYSLEIHGFRVKNPSGNGGGLGIANGSSKNYITHNIFYSNDGNTGSMGAPSMGIIINAANCSNTVVATNQFYANMIDVGILAGHNIQIFSNTAHGAGFSLLL